MAATTVAARPIVKVAVDDKRKSVGIQMALRYGLKMEGKLNREGTVPDATARLIVKLQMFVIGDDFLFVQRSCDTELWRYDE